jgi:hypothetical protein
MGLTSCSTTARKRARTAKLLRSSSACVQGVISTMPKANITVDRLSSGSIFKIIFISTAFLALVINTLVILYHLLTGDFVINYLSGEDKIESEISLFKYIFVSYPAIMFGALIQTCIVWLWCAASMALWSYVKPLKLEYYEHEKKEI